MYSKDYELLVNRLVLENNKIRNMQKVWLEKEKLDYVDVAEIAHKHNNETIRFIKKLDKEIEEDDRSRSE